MEPKQGIVDKLLRLRTTILSRGLACRPFKAEAQTMSQLPWPERVAMLSINPDAATRHDVARLAADLMELMQAQVRGQAMKSDEALELLPCPFCGGLAIETRRVNGYAE